MKRVHIGPPCVVRCRSSSACPMRTRQLLYGFSCIARLDVVASMPPWCPLAPAGRHTLPVLGVCTCLAVGSGLEVLVTNLNARLNPSWHVHVMSCCDAEREAPSLGHALFASPCMPGAVVLAWGLVVSRPVPMSCPSSTCVVLVTRVRRPGPLRRTCLGGYKQRCLPLFSSFLSVLIV